MSKKIFDRDNSGTDLDLSNLDKDQMTKGPKNVFDLIANNENLRTLNLSNNDFSSDGMFDHEKLSEYLKTNTSLVKLKMSNCSLSTLPHLNFLNSLIEGGDLKSKLVMFDQIISSKKSDSSVDSDTFFGGLIKSGISFFGRLIIRIKEDSNSDGNNKSLKVLDLSNNDFNDFGLHMIRLVLMHNESLEELNLSGCNIDNDGIKIICEGLKHNRSLKILDLGGNKIDNNGIEDIVRAVENNESLKTLNLKNNNIDSKKLKNIAEALDHSETIFLEKEVVIDVKPLVLNTNKDEVEPLGLNISDDDGVSE